MEFVNKQNINSLKENSGSKTGLKRSLFDRAGSKDLIKKYSSQFLPNIRAKAEQTDFTGYHKSQEEAHILFMLALQRPEDKGGAGGKSFALEPKLVPVKALQAGEEAFLVLDKSCFYPEGGGPIGDRGRFQTQTGKAEVLDCQKSSDFLWHKIKVLEGELQEGQKAQMEVNAHHREEISASHTATHLLHSALRDIFGERVRQEGSLSGAGLFEV